MMHLLVSALAANSIPVTASLWFLSPASRPCYRLLNHPVIISQAEQAPGQLTAPLLPTVCTHHGHHVPYFYINDPQRPPAHRNQGRDRREETRSPPSRNAATMRPPLGGYHRLKRHDDADDSFGHDKQWRSQKTRCSKCATTYRAAAALDWL